MMFSLTSQPTIEPNYEPFGPIIHMIDGMMIFVIIGALFLLLIKLLIAIVKQPPQHSKIERPVKPSPASNVVRNKGQVIGWELASRQELETLKPAELQTLLDRRNGFSDRIAQLLDYGQRLEQLPSAQDTRRLVETTVKKLRQLPSVIVAQQDEREVKALIERVDQEVKYVLEQP